MSNFEKNATWHGPENNISLAKSMVKGMVGDGLFNSLSTYDISQICNVSRYTKCVQNLCKNLAPVLSLQKCSTGAK